MNKSINVRDMTAGVLLVTVAAIGLYINRDYEAGAANHMGPGYVPMVVLSVLALLGITLAVTGVRTGPARLERWAWRELSLVLLALVLFGGFLEHIGIALSVVILVAVGALADRSQTVKGTIGLACFLVLACWLVFSWALGLSVPFLPPFMAWV